MTCLDHGAGRVVDQDDVGVSSVQGRQPGGHRAVPRRAARREGPAREAFEGGLGQLPVLGRDDDHDASGPGLQHRLQRPAGDDLAPQGAPLLGAARPGALSGSGGDDDGAKLHVAV